MQTDMSSLDDRVAGLLASDPELMQDAYPILNELRDVRPVHRIGDYVLVSRYEDVCSVFAVPGDFSNHTMDEDTARVRDARASLSPEQRPKYEDFLRMEWAMTFMADGQEHADRRKTFSHLFSPARIKKLHDLTQRYTDELFDAVAVGGVADIYPVTGLLPGWIIANLLGLPREDSPFLVELGDAINMNLHRSTHVDSAHAALESVRGYVQAKVDGEGIDPASRTELFEAILGAPDQRRLTSIFIEMQVGGYETTRGLLSGGILLLMQNRDQWDMLVADPTLAGNAVEELLRLVSPAQWTARVSTMDTTIGGTEIRKGDTLLLMLAAANRDPKMFPDPDRLDITRANASMHRAFGIGPHYCIGQALARMEGTIFFRTLATRFPELHLTGATPRRIGNANNPKLDGLTIEPGRAAEVSSDA